MKSGRAGGGRPKSSTAAGRASSSSMTPMMMGNGAEGMSRGLTYSPTPSAPSQQQPVYYPHPQHHHHQQQQDYHQIDPQLMGYPAQPHPHHPQEMTPYSHHQLAHGRVALPMHGGSTLSIPQHSQHHETPSPNPHDDFSHSPFLPEDPSGGSGASPFARPLDLPPVNDASPMMMHAQMVSPTEHLDLHRHHSMPMPMHHQHQQQAYLAFPPQKLQRSGSMGPARPQVARSHTMQAPPRPAQLQRHNSLQPPPVARSASPHMMAGDIFDPTPAPASPVKRPMSSLAMMETAGQEVDMRFEYPGGEMVFYPQQQMAQGISPARALGPAPVDPHRFSPHANQHGDPMITPQVKTGYNVHAPSSATSSTASSSHAPSTGSSSLSSVEQQQRHRAGLPPSDDDDENDSPTKGPSASRQMQKMQLNEMPVPNARPTPRIAQQQAASRLALPSAVKPNKPAVVGGRTSAKFAKVAEDPGVEGVPPGPRPLDRPQPSFACIIGQAILKCSAGGLSLEHIYRYVETAYPYFKSGDGAWRNSVRHNLSIHKMFETIPRTEMFPPGKGGIWIIHEDEKCHWPEENKFIKNFPASHPHHAVCRQTLHEKQKEKEAMEKARREGRVYVPKKGKKGKKMSSKDDDGDDGEGMGELEVGGVPMAMVRSSSSNGTMGAPPARLVHPPPHSTHVHQHQHQHQHPHPHQHQHHQPMLQEPLPPSEFEDDGADFLPMDMIAESSQAGDSVAELEMLLPTTSPIEDPTYHREDRLARQGAMVPPRFERKRKAPPGVGVGEEEENVFTTSSSSVKRVRVAEPLQPMLPPQELLDDSFITPERERPSSHPHSSKPSGSSSAFKTPALVNTSSSPTSSPMPPTVTRHSHSHHPSALQQTWTKEDFTATSVTSPSTTPPPMLDAAFDFKPKHGGGGGGGLLRKTLDGSGGGGKDDDAPTQPTHHDRPPPKTPVTRSSAGAERPTFKTPMGKGTPLMFTNNSPKLPPPSASTFLSTPLWEADGCLSRLKDRDQYGGMWGSPTATAAIRMSPVPPTSPTRYQMLLGSEGSPRRGGMAMREFSL